MLNAASGHSSISPAAPCRSWSQAVNALGEPGIVFDREPRAALSADRAGRPCARLDRHATAMASPAWSGCSTRGCIDPARRGEPVALSIDSRVQAVLETELATAVTAMNAEGGTGIVLDVAPARSSPWPRRRPSTPTPPAAPTPTRSTTGRRWASTSSARPSSRSPSPRRWRRASSPRCSSAGTPPRRSRSAASGSATTIRSAGMINVPELMVHSSNIATARVADAMGAGADAGRVPRARLRRAAGDRAARAQRARSGRATGAGRRC